MCLLYREKKEYDRGKEVLGSWDLELNKTKAKKKGPLLILISLYGAFVSKEFRIFFSLL
jgi:hypothetical protein